MGKVGKLERFEQVKGFTNVLEPALEDIRSGDHSLKGKWHEEVFRNNNPIVLELACGKGEYTVGLSEQYPDKNFIGIDIKGNRMWVGAKKCLEAERSNAVFLRTRIDFIDRFFDKGEISEIWIIFPDPQPKDSQIKKRLTSERFLELYRNFLAPEGPIHLKTDNLQLHFFTKELLEEKEMKVHLATDDLYRCNQSEFTPEELHALNIKTFYEQMFLEEGKAITYLKFSF